MPYTLGCMYMTVDRLVVRLDTDHRKKLEELSERRQESMSDLVRRMIDAAYEEEMRDWRHQLVREIAALNVENVPEPDELSRQLNSKYDFERLC
jgi:Ribbon-helix-helix protein, copG family